MNNAKHDARKLKRKIIQNSTSVEERGTRLENVHMKMQVKEKRRRVMGQITKNQDALTKISW
jgi:hypothetical protein